MAENNLYPFDELDHMKDLHRKQEFVRDPSSSSFVVSPQSPSNTLPVPNADNTPPLITFDDTQGVADSVRQNQINTLNNNYLSQIMMSPVFVQERSVYQTSSSSHQGGSYQNSFKRGAGDGQTSENLIKTSKRSVNRMSQHRLYSIAECQYLLPAFRPGFRPRSNQCFLIELPFDYRTGRDPKPYPVPRNRIDFWDNDHVKMPYSNKNQCRITHGSSGSNSGSVPTWKIIEKSLDKNMNSFKQLDQAIKSYNNYDNIKFDVLKKLLDSSSVTNVFEILNYMRDLALKLPDIVTQSPPLLKQKQNMTLIMSQKQIACLLANAFFCTFPRRSKDNEEYQEYPLFNFVSLFSSDKISSMKIVKIEKLKAIFNYFKWFIKEKPTGIVTIERKVAKDLPDWSNSDKALGKLQVEESGTIEKEGKMYSEVDFANRFIGGGVLRSGSLQEEMRFLISPELIVSRLFTEALLDNEALVINGTVQCNEFDINYSNNTFTWKRGVRENLDKDTWGRNYSQIIAIDSYEFNANNVQDQFNKDFIDRALNKAFCGFKDDLKYKSYGKPAIASGKWGCGGFNGDPYLSCLIQYMAASQVDRDSVLFIMNDIKLKDDLDNLADICYQNKLCVKDLYKILVKYQNEGQAVRDSTNVIQFIIKESTK